MSNKEHWHEIDDPQTDPRKMAACVIVCREKMVKFSSKQQLLLIRDKSISETASGLRVVSTKGSKDDMRWSIPGGGRKLQLVGQGGPQMESYEDTVVREMWEEVGVHIGVASEVTLIRQVYPFLIAQWLGQEIAVLPAVCSVLEFDSLPRKARHDIDKPRKKDTFLWKNINELIYIYGQLVRREEEGKVDTEYRLPALAAAYVYHLTQKGDNSEKIQKMNTLTYQQVIQLAAQDKLPITDGIITIDSGVVTPESKDDVQFLFGSKRQKIGRNRSN